MKFNKMLLAMGMAAVLPMALQADCGKETCAAGAAKTTACAADKAECAAEKGECAVEKAECATACATACAAEKAECTGACDTACCSAETPAKFTKVEYKIEGMTCGGCSTKVQGALTKINGVKVEKVCHESNSAVVAFDPKTVKDKDVITAINNTGFNVEAEIIDVKVDGMTCGGCSGKVGSALTQIDGVKKQEVCHVSKKAVVEFDPKKVSRDKVLAAINGTGFKVVE